MEYGIMMYYACLNGSMNMIFNPDNGKLAFVNGFLLTFLFFYIMKIYC